MNLKKRLLNNCSRHHIAKENIVDICLLESLSFFAFFSLSSLLFNLKKLEFSEINALPIKTSKRDSPVIIN